jgi:hypothetical protein
LEEVKDKIEHFTEESRRYLDEKIESYERITREGFEGIRAELATLARAEAEEVEEEEEEEAPGDGVVMIEAAPAEEEEEEAEETAPESPRRSGFFRL